VLAITETECELCHRFNETPDLEEEFLRIVRTYDLIIKYNNTAREQ
jgi:hypothetical protein